MAPVRAAGVDSDSAFNRIAAHADTCVVLTAEFSGKWVDSPHDILTLRPALPFG